MTFVDVLRDKFDAWDENEEYWNMEEFWNTLASSKEAEVGGHNIKVLSVTGGPNDHSGDDYEFALEVDGETYVALVDYDSYEYSGNQWSIYHAEPYEFTETRYKRLARAR